MKTVLFTVVLVLPLLALLGVPRRALRPSKLLALEAWKPLLPDHIGKMQFESRELKPLFSSDPAIELPADGCCLEMVTAQTWDSKSVQLKIDDRTLFPLNTVGSVRASLAGGLTPFASGLASVWAVDQKRRRVVQLTGESVSPLPGSEVLGAAQSVIATQFDYIKGRNPGKGDEVFIASEPSRKGDAMVVAHMRPDFTGIKPVVAGLQLEHPTGLALSYDRKRLYIANERSSKDEHSPALEWIELARENVCSEQWSSKGVLARFPLTKEQERLFRGLIVHKTGVLIGSAPGGLVFVSPQGSLLGTLATPQEITYLVPSAKGIYVAIDSQLGLLPLKGASDPLLNPAQCNLDPPPPPKPAARKCHSIESSNECASHCRREGHRRRHYRE
jgi:hypothetical protein